VSARKTCITVGSAACLAIACGAVKKSEGYAPTVVPDRLAGGLPTGGYGETEGVKLGETHNEKFWSDRLARRLAEEYDAGIGQCIRVDLPDGVRAMAISASYNAGVSAVCSSPMVRKWNAGDIRGGCEAIRGWRVGSHPVKGGPLVVQRGLINRRNSEAAKCLAGIVPAPKGVDFQSAPKSAEVPVNTAHRGDFLEPQKPPPIVASNPPAPKAEGFWSSLWSRLHCWIFKCEVKA
jgi:lysozyme